MNIVKIGKKLNIFEYDVVNIKKFIDFEKEKIVNFCKEEVRRKVEEEKEKERKVEIEYEGGEGG